MPDFTQKHYEHVARELHRAGREVPVEYTVRLMASIFRRDNPKFKAALFVRQCRDGVQPREKTHG